MAAALTVSASPHPPCHVSLVLQCGRHSVDIAGYKLCVALVLDSQNVRIDQLTAYECSECDRVRLRSIDVAESNYLHSLLTYRIR